MTRTRVTDEQIINAWHPKVFRDVRSEPLRPIDWSDPGEAGQPAERDWRLRSCGSRKRLRRRTALGVTSTSSSLSI